MIWELPPYLLILVVTVAVTLTVAAVAWRRRETPGVLPFVLLMLAVAWWAGFSFLEYLADGYDAKLTFGKLQYFGIGSVPVLWLIFALSYCGLNRFLTRRNLVFLWVIPVITIALALTNDLHHALWHNVVMGSASPVTALDYTDYGPWWWVVLIYGYSLVISGMVIFFRQALFLRSKFRRQAVALQIAVFVPLAANVFYLLRIYPIPGLTDLTPFAFSITGVVVVWGLFQFQLFDLTPVARDLIIESMNDGAIVLDEHDRIVDINPAAVQFLGLSAPSIGQLAEKVFECWPELLRRYRQITETPSEIKLEAGVKPRYAELRVSALRNRRGRLVGRFITLHDISLRRQTEATLRQLSRAVEQSPATVMITDTAGQIVYVNPRFTRLTGYSLEEVLGRNPNILKSGKTTPEEYARLWQTIQSGGEWHGELLNKKKSGELYWEAAVISPIIDADGAITHYLAVKEDITERKQTELELQQSRARLKAIFDNAAVGIALIDRDGHYIQFNDRWAEMLWYPPEQLSQLRDVDITHPDDWAETTQRQQALLRGEIDYYELEKRYVRKDGSVFWGLLSMTPIRNAQSEFQAGLGVVADITERKRVEELERQRLIESEALRATMTEVLGELELSKLLRALMERVVASLQGDQGEAALYDERAHELEIVISYNQGRDFTGLRQTLGEGALGQVAQTRQSLIIEDYAAWEGRIPRIAEGAQALTILAAPMLSGSTLLGAIAVGADNRRRKFAAQDLRLMETFAQQAAIAIYNARLFEEVRQRAQRLALVNDISMEISSVSANLREVLQASVDGLTRVLGVDQVGLALFDETRQHLTVQADHPAPGNQSSVGTELAVLGNLSMQRVLETRRPLMILDARHDPLLSNVQDVMVRQRIQSLLLVPLIVRNEVIGTIGFDALHAPRVFTQEEIELAQTVANLVAVRIEQARLFDAERAARRQAQRHAADMRAVYAITRATSRSLVVEDVLSQALSSAIVALNVEAGAIALFESSEVNAPLRLVAERGLSTNVVDWMRARWLNNILDSHIFQQSAAVIISEPDGEIAPALREMAEEMSALGWGLCLIIPMLHREQPQGVMCLLARQSQAAGLHDMVLLTSIGQQVATAVTNAQLFQSTISERSRLKALIESSRDGVILTSIEGRVLVVNAQALTLLRLVGQPENWVGTTFVELIAALRRNAPQAATATLAEMRRLRAEKTEPAEGQFEAPPHAIRWQSLPVRMGAKPMGRLFVLRDMTEERAVERMREDMARTMVHDLRNPLSGITVALDMVLDGTTGDISQEQQQIISVARQSAGRMMQLVGAILDVSRLEGGQMPVESQAFSLSDLVETTLMSQRALADEQEIHLQSDVAYDLPPVWADFGLIQRVMQNLVGNAIKFSPTHSSVRIEAKLEQQANPPVIWVSISDTGPGIPPEIQNRLFQKFVTGTQQEHGSGLGLAFCKLAIEAHGQHIWLDSVPGHGAIFTFSLATAEPSAFTK